MSRIEIPRTQAATEPVGSAAVGAKPATAQTVGAEPAGANGVRANAAAPSDPLSGCPTPLFWQDIVQKVVEGSDAWYLPQSQGAAAGTQVFGRTFGRGRPLYLLNGIGGTCEQFALLVWLLREEFRSVLHNYVGTDKPLRYSKPPTLNDLADQCVAIADQHGDAQFDVFATSFGSLVAWNLASRYPQRVRKLVVAGGFARRRVSWFESLLITALQPVTLPLSWLPGRAAVQSASHRRWFPKEDDGRWSFMQQNAGSLPIRTIAQRAAIVRQTDASPWIAGLKQPVTLVRCEGDGIVSAACSDELEALLPNCHRQWIPSAGHLPYFTSPHRLAKLIRDALADAPIAPSPPIP